MAGPTTRARLTHQPALDGVRGLAVAAVLIFHGGHLTGGYLGVDAFFVLSGFLITSLLLSEATAHGDISLRTFWARRARRLLPALACVLLAVAFYAAFVAQPNELSTIRGDALATIAYVANWRQIFTSNDYFALFRSPSPLQHTWSLAIEEQFYLLWPLLVFALVRRRSPSDAARRVLWASVLLAGGSFVLMQLLFKPDDVSRVYYGTDTRIASILIGSALAALLMLRGEVTSRRARTALEVAALAGAVLLAAAWTHLSGSSPTLYRGGLLLCALATATVIAAGVHSERGPVAHALSWRPLCALGIISYGVYLWHWPVYVYLNSTRLHVTGWPLLCVQIAVTLAVAYLSYRLVERPVRRGLGSTELMLRLMPAAAVVLVVVIVVATAGATSQPATAANATTPGGVLVVGDSVAHTLVPGLREAGYQVGEVWKPGCRLLTGTIPVPPLFAENCEWRKPFATSVRNFRPTVVIAMIGTWDLFDIRPPGSSVVLRPGSTAWNQRYTAALEAEIRILSAQHARIVIPTIPCITALKGTPGFSAHSAVDVRRVNAANAIIKGVAVHHRGIVSAPDLFRFLCPHGAFQRDVEGVSRVRPDGLHFSRAGAALVTRWLAPLLPASKAGAILVVGDSVAHSLVPGLQDSGFQVTENTIAGCRLARGRVQINAIVGADCPWPNLWHGSIVKEHPAVVVLISGAWDLYDVRPAGSTRTLVPGSAAWDDYYARILQHAINVLSARGAHVVIPTIPFIGSFAARTALGERSAFDPARVRAANRVLVRVVATNRSVASAPDLNHFLAPGGVFQNSLDGVKHMRVDGVHYTRQGADLIAAWLAPQLTAQTTGSGTGRVASP